MKASQFLGKVPGVKKEFHRCHLLRNEMIHFIDNLFNYLMVEVIEATWDQFKEKLGGLKEMNELIELHENCIDKILEKKEKYGYLDIDLKDIHPDKTFAKKKKK